MLNGIPGGHIYHRKGLRQGDPLSPLLFIIAIDPLHRLLARATDMQMLALLPGREIPLTVGLYADDAIIFATLTRQEIGTLLGILHDFGNATGLRINPVESTATAIRCEGIDLQEVLHSFGGQTVDFPVRYLGLPSRCRGCASSTSSSS